MLATIVFEAPSKADFDGSLFDSRGITVLFMLEHEDSILKISKD